MKNTITVDVSGLTDAEKDLTRSASALPGALARGLNATVESARKGLVEDALKRYALNAAGARHLNDLKQRERASAARLVAGMRIRKMGNDLGYFETHPNVPLPGDKWRLAPSSGFMGHVLRSTSMQTLPGDNTSRSKAFLAKFKSGHVGMVQRQINVPSKSTVTARGRPRWKNKYGKVEALQTLSSLSAAAQVNTVWPQEKTDAAEEFFRRLSALMQEG